VKSYSYGVGVKQIHVKGNKQKEEEGQNKDGGDHGGGEH
jgi:hypothetical protein